MSDNFFAELNTYAINTPHIESVIIVGSYARGANKESSDLDIVIITSDTSEMIENQSFTRKFGEVYRRQTEYYGACTSVRAWYADGKEVEFGIVAPFWIAEPLDAGTHRVLSGGYKVIADKKHYFENLKL